MAVCTTLVFSLGGSGCSEKTRGDDIAALKEAQRKVGQLRPGQTITEVVQILGLPDRERSDESGGKIYEYRKRVSTVETNGSEKYAKIFTVFVYFDKRGLSYRAFQSAGRQRIE